MRRIDLYEYRRSEATALNAEEREILSSVARVEPARPDGSYHLTPGSTVGALSVGDLSVLIQPKLPVRRVLYLASYAMSDLDIHEEYFDFRDAPTLIEAILPAFTAAASHAFGRGLLHGYRTTDDSLNTVRGRVRANDQIRRRFNIVAPVEVRYDDFTDDILANRLVKAAATRLGKLAPGSEYSARMRLIDATLQNVAAVDFHPNAVPVVAFDRLNEHYRDVVTLARLILRHTVIESERGAVRASGFLIDMNRVFQAFVTRALRERLGLSERTFRSDKGSPTVHLDDGGQLALRPDLTWWDGDDCTFVGDVKYKRLQHENVPNADLYQLFAYTTAFDLSGGLLVYAAGEATDTVYNVRGTDKSLSVATLELSGEIDDLRARIEELADRVRALHDDECDALRPNRDRLALRAVAQPDWSSTKTRPSLVSASARRTGSAY